jgi:hypothetical protein
MVFFIMFQINSHYLISSLYYAFSYGIDQNKVAYIYIYHSVMTHEGTEV